MSQNVPFCVCPFKCKWAGAPGPLSEEGRASRVHAPAYRQQQTISCTENFRNSQAVDFTLLLYNIFNYHIPIYDHSGSTWRQHRWKQAETMVALATLALQIAKRIFGKQNMTRLLCLELMFTHEVLVLIPLSESTFAKIQHWNDPRLWGSRV